MFSFFGHWQILILKMLSKIYIPSTSKDTKFQSKPWSIISDKMSSHPMNIFWCKKTDQERCSQKQNQCLSLSIVFWPCFRRFEHFVLLIIWFCLPAGRLQYCWMWPQTGQTFILPLQFYLEGRNIRYEVILVVFSP